MNKGELPFCLCKSRIKCDKHLQTVQFDEEVIMVVTGVYREMAVYLWLYLVVLNVVLNFRGTPQAAPSHQTIYVIISNRAHRE